MSESDTPRRVSRRPEQNETSPKMVGIRCTEEERTRWQQLAKARVKDFSTLVRELLEREYELEFPGRRRASKRPRKG